MTGDVRTVNLELPTWERAKNKAPPIIHIWTRSPDGTYACAACSTTGIRPGASCRCARRRPGDSVRGAEPGAASGTTSGEASAARPETDSDARPRLAPGERAADAPPTSSADDDGLPSADEYRRAFAQLAAQTNRVVALMAEADGPALKRLISMSRAIEVSGRVLRHGYQAMRDREVVDVVERYERMEAELARMQTSRRAVHGDAAPEVEAEAEADAAEGYVQ